jgi:hypothetical protein
MNGKKLPSSWRHIRMAEFAKQQINHHYISVKSNKYKINPCNSERITLLYNVHEQSSKKSLASISAIPQKPYSYKNDHNFSGKKKNTLENQSNHQGIVRKIKIFAIRNIRIETIGSNKKPRIEKTAIVQ